MGCAGCCGSRRTPPQPISQRPLRQRGCFPFAEHGRPVLLLIHPEREPAYEGGGWRVLRARVKIPGAARRPRSPPPALRDPLGLYLPHSRDDSCIRRIHISATLLSRGHLFSENTFVLTGIRGLVVAGKATTHNNIRGGDARWHHCCCPFANKHSHCQPYRTFFTRKTLNSLDLILLCKQTHYLRNN